ncbi:MAG: o-succinylbenzoate synthase [Crocinitomicaceae bacterium]|nr:o-succinylbenzoate synthase [Crocinitomicaceae bacterium]
MDKLLAKYSKKTFHFKRPSGTSRGVLTEKHSWFIEVWDPTNPSIVGTGECSVIPGLSPDFKDVQEYTAKLEETCRDLTLDLTDWPSIKFGVETALLDLQSGAKGLIFENDFYYGKRKILINGLIWMGDEDFMKKQIDEKLDAGFTTIKMKIGAIGFDAELALLKSIREDYSAEDITLRVDANGAFPVNNALEMLKRLAELDIHSIEQPIKAGQWEEMARLCKSTPLPIALDEELIGVNTSSDKAALLDTIQPQFIILKPSLHGGISGSKEWIELAEKRNIPWWMTSALESNIGLNAICQFNAEYNNDLPQGLGTGSLYTDNIESNLVVKTGSIFYSS